MSDPSLLLYKQPLGVLLRPSARAQGSGSAELLAAAGPGATVNGLNLQCCVSAPAVAFALAPGFCWHIRTDDDPETQLAP